LKTSFFFFLAGVAVVVGRTPGVPTVMTASVSSPSAARRQGKPQMSARKSLPNRWNRNAKLFAIDRVCPKQGYASEAAAKAKEGRFWESVATAAEDQADPTSVSRVALKQAGNAAKNEDCKIKCSIKQRRDKDRLGSMVAVELG
jgi:hypothetical protein